MNVLLVGPLASGKTTIAEKLLERGFANNYDSVELCRRAHSSGSHAGEMLAWARFLESIEEPEEGNNVFEFSGTGRFVYSVGEAIRSTFDDKQKWLVVYVLADEEVLLQRALEKTYDAPCPYELNDPRASINFMNQDLKKTLENSRAWASAPKIVVRTDLKNVDEAVDQIINVVEEIQ